MLFATKETSGDWVELTFAKFSGTVTEAGEKWPISDQRVPRNDPRDICGTQVGVTVTWASPRFGHPHSQNPSDMGIPCNPKPNPNPNR